MDVVNIAAPEFTYDEADPAGFRSGMHRLGSLVGASKTGMSIYELPPGQAVCPYHYEYGEEEWLVVLEGAPTLRTPEGERRLQPWDVVCFPSGPDGAHLVRNDAAEGADGAVRILMFSNTISPCISVYPDSGKVGAWTGNEADNLLAFKTSRVEYFAGEDV
jgi:uncharacterized cupin superfamily protein